MVEQRGARLRPLSFGALKELGRVPAEAVTVQGRPATIGITVLERGEDAIAVVVVGLMPARWFIGNNVALDGFCKYRDGRVGIMPDEELDKFG
jgi:hypothetical protein